MSVVVVFDDIVVVAAFFFFFCRKTQELKGKLLNHIDGSEKSVHKDSV